MRSLFMLLLVINISYLIWGVAFSEKNIAQQENKLPVGLPSISMLSENLENKKIKQTNKTVVKKDSPVKKLPDVGVTAELCFSIGPFVEKKQLDKLQLRLKRRGIASKSKSITDKEPKSYWVHKPPVKTMEEAVEITKKLQAGKFSDYFIIRKGKNTRAISLGLYKSFRRAKQIKDQLKKIGVESKIETRYRDITRHWLDYQENKTTPLSDKVWKQADKDIEMQKVARPCVDPLPKNG